MTAPRVLLIVDDNPGDIRLIEEAFRGVQPQVAIESVPTGEAALDHLRAAAADPTRNLPNLILLDLNLPRKHGHEVLAELKADLALAAIPVIVLSASSAEQDIERSYRARANAYITKPTDIDDLYKVVDQIHSFWFRTARLTPGVD